MYSQRSKQCQQKGDTRLWFCESTQEVQHLWEVLHCAYQHCYNWNLFCAPCEELIFSTFEHFLFTLHMSAGSDVPLCVFNFFSLSLFPLSASFPCHSVCLSDNEVTRAKNKKISRWFGRTKQHLLTVSNWPCQIFATFRSAMCTSNYFWRETSLQHCNAESLVWPKPLLLSIKSGQACAGTTVVWFITDLVLVALDKHVSRSYSSHKEAPERLHREGRVSAVCLSDRAAHANSVNVVQVMVWIEKAKTLFRILTSTVASGSIYIPCTIFLVDLHQRILKLFFPRTQKMLSRPENKKPFQMRSPVFKCSWFSCLLGLDGNLTVVSGHEVFSCRSVVSHWASVASPQRLSQNEHNGSLFRHRKEQKHKSQSQQNHRKETAVLWKP